LLLEFGFTELNLFSLLADVPEYNLAGLRLFKKVGFLEDACLRQAIFRDGRRWDMIFLGLLADEWRVKHG
jgi:RimJ/RimL family protein N-acetyltransferase